ncbi:uncharacterized protein LOC123557204 isoform X2 [Mercenaria mercenaria]|nr:uncharacterized protein LOC123557204 isoform X2 [Mercenaria mercenaria]
MVQKLSASSSSSTRDEVSPSAEQLVSDSGDPDELPEQMSESQKFFLSIGIRQERPVQGCSETQLKLSFPNIDYAFLGYDMYRGYPLADSHDPGFTNPIFRADYSEKHQSADCRYSIPNGFVAISDVSCVASFSSTVIETKEELVKTLSTMAEFSLGSAKAEFSTSFGYKKTTSSLAQGNSVFIVSSAHCDYYFVKIRKETPPTFDDGFLIWLSKLDITDTNTTYLEFLDRYGTHFITEATFGARFSNEYKMKSDYYQSVKDTKYSASVRASYSGKKSIGAGFNLETGQREAASEFTENVETRTITVGAAPPSNGDALTWASEVQQNPVPSRYTLEPIENLFVKEFVGPLGIDYEMIRFNLMKYKDDYKRYREQQSPDFTLGNNQNNEIVLWEVKQTLHIKGGGIQGTWGVAEFCPQGSFAIGYNLKIEPDQGKGDDTGLNAIKLICADQYGFIRGNEITSTQAIWGSYRKENKLCPKSGKTVYFLTRYSLQMHDWDHIAASFVTFKCQDLNKTKEELQLEIFPGHGEPWGRYWGTSDSCPIGTAICGLKTKVEKQQDKGHDSALNDVKFFCCGRDVIN